MTTWDADVSLRIEVLDVQIVDRDHLPIGRVDDLELEVPDPGEEPKVTSLLSGQATLGRRLGGVVGSALTRVADRLADAQEGGAGLRLAPHDVAEWGSVLTLHAGFDDLPQGAGLESWLSRHVVRPIPGSGS